MRHRKRRTNHSSAHSSTDALTPRTTLRYGFTVQRLPARPATCGAVHARCRQYTWCLEYYATAACSAGWARHLRRRARPLPAARSDPVPATRAAPCNGDRSTVFARSLGLHAAHRQVPVRALAQRGCMPASACRRAHSASTREENIPGCCLSVFLHVACGHTAGRQGTLHTGAPQAGVQPRAAPGTGAVQRAAPGGGTRSRRAGSSPC